MCDGRCARYFLRPVGKVRSIRGWPELLRTIQRRNSIPAPLRVPLAPANLPFRYFGKPLGLMQPRHDPCGSCDSWGAGAR